MTPDARSNRDLRVELNAHLEIALQDRFGDGERTGGGGVTLEAADHCIVVAFLGRLGRCDSRGAVDGFVEDWIVRIVLLHGAEVVGTFKEVLALPRGVLCAYRLAINTLRRQTL